MIPPLGSVGLIRFLFCLHPCLHRLVLLSKTIDKSGSLNGDHLRFTGEFIWAVWSLLTFFFFFNWKCSSANYCAAYCFSFFNEWFERDGFWISEHRSHRRGSVEAITISQLNMPAQYYIKWEVWHVWDVRPDSGHPQAKVNFLPSVYSKRKLESRSLTECLFSRLTWDVMCMQTRGL